MHFINQFLCLQANRQPKRRSRKKKRNDIFYASSVFVPPLMSSKKRKSFDSATTLKSLKYVFLDYVTPMIPTSRGLYTDGFISVENVSETYFWPCQYYEQLYQFYVDFAIFICELVPSSVYFLCI